MKPVLVESTEQMAALASQIENAAVIAVDTEFFRETTYFPQLALVQIATDNIVACIDPLAFDAKDALKKILLDNTIVKIFHSCSQDLEVLYYYLGQAPTAIYDTQIANALLTDFHQIGYASLVENELGVTLDKSQTRTNWLQRPLTDKQIQYAADDVIFLYRLQARLDKKLLESGRKPWFEEDSEALNRQSGNFQVATDKLWKRVKGASRLARDKLAVVQAIAIWREQLAQKHDKTRRKILADDSVIELALEPPENSSTLDQIMPPGQRLSAEEKQDLLSVIKHAQQSPPATWPDNRFNSLNTEQKQMLKQLQKIINSSAEQLAINSAVLCSRKDLEALIFYYENQDSTALPEINIMNGWRYRYVGQRLIESIKQNR